MATQLFLPGLPRSCGPKSLPVRRYQTLGHGSPKRRAASKIANWLTAALSSGCCVFNWRLLAMAGRFSIGGFRPNRDASSGPAPHRGPAEGLGRGQAVESHSGPQSKNGNTPCVRHPWVASRIESYTSISRFRANSRRGEYFATLWKEPGAPAVDGRHSLTRGIP